MCGGKNEKDLDEKRWTDILLSMHVNPFSVSKHNDTFLWVEMERLKFMNG